jgi:uncharacterized membrane protein
MREARLARIALTLGVWVWVAALVLAPGAVFPIGHFICHQRPERSFFFEGRQLAVCARCTGLYAGAALAAPLAFAFAAGPNSTRSRVVLGVAALPTLVTWTLEFVGLVPFSNWSRFTAAVPLGFAAAWLVFSTLAEPVPLRHPPGRR